MRRAACCAGLLVAGLLTLPAPAHAQDDEDLDLDELNERAEALEEEYDGELHQYTEAKEAAEAAEAELEEINAELDEARSRVSELAATQYMGSGIDPAIEFAFSAAPEDLLEGASVLSYMSESDSEHVLNLVELRESSEEASEDADEKLEEAEELVNELEGQRDEILERIDRYEQEQTPAPSTDGGGGGGVIGPGGAEGPGFHEVTARMAAVRDEIIDRFGAPYPVGCYRPGDPQDHGSGQACDFMMSANGAMPSDENLALGDSIADYAVANADRLGVKYVIWKQRIWDSRNAGAGWTQMSDRGSITANHWDHPHISVF